jgi:hypothetical protein
MASKTFKIKQLFKPSDQPHGGNVVLSFTGQPKAELALVGDAYYNAARRLLEAFGADRACSDLDAYPIVFLCRHALELLIKAVLTIGNDLAGLLEEPSLRVKDIYADHSLAKNIPQLKRVFQAMGWEDAFEQAGMARGEFEQIIKEFEGFDPNSFTRYPINKDGSASLKEKHFVFSPKQFVETLDPILKSLSGVCSGLEEYRQQLADAKTDLAAYAQDDYSPGDYAQRFIPLKLQLDLIITITSEPIGVSELLFPSRQQSRQDWPSGDPTDPLAVQPNRSIP